MTDPYKILGVSSDASDEEIKKSYRELVRKYHPDLHPGDEEAAAKMSEINSAYDIIRSGTDSAGRPVQAEDNGEETKNDIPDEEAVEKADELIKSGDMQGAKELLEGVKVKSAKWHYLRAIIEYATGNMGIAVKFMENAVLLEPDNEAYRTMKSKMEDIPLAFYGSEENKGGCSIKMITWFLRAIAIIVVVAIFMTLLGTAGFFMRK